MGAAFTRLPRHSAFIAISAGLALLALLSSPAQAAAKCRATSAQPESISIAKAERSVFCLLNERRSKRGLRKLDRQGQLARASRAHSRHMVDTGCFAHDCPGETKLFDRLVEVGYLDGFSGWGYGENIAWGGGKLGSPKSIVSAWMRSPGHRRNLLDREFEDLGVGLVWGSPSGSSFAAATYTTDFGFRDR